MRSREWKHFHCEWLVLCLRWDSIHLQSTHRRCCRLAAGARTTWYFSIFHFRLLDFIHFSIEFTSPSCRPHFPPRWRDDAWNCVKISLSRSHSASTIVLLSPPSSHFCAESRRGRNSTRLIFWNNLVCPPVTLSFSLSLGRTLGLGHRSVSDTQSTFTITPNSSALCWGLRWGVDEMIVNSWVYHTQNLFCFSSSSTNFRLLLALELSRALESSQAERKRESMIFFYPFHKNEPTNGWRGRKRVGRKKQKSGEEMRWVRRTASVDKCALLGLRVGKLFLDSIIFFSDFFSPSSLSLALVCCHFFSPLNIELTK